MIAKVISHGPDRLSALQTLDTALSQLQVSLTGCQPILSHACFGQQPPEAAEPRLGDLAWCEAAIYQYGLCRLGLPPCSPRAVQQLLPCEWATNRASHVARAMPTCQQVLKAHMYDLSMATNAVLLTVLLIQQTSLQHGLHF